MSTEFSINNFNEESNILSKKIFDMMELNIKGGSNNCFSLESSIIFLLGIIIAIIGTFLLWSKNDLIETSSIILSKSCSNTDDCKINIIYNVNSMVYSKIINISKNDILNTNKLKIYYSKMDPNIIYLDDTDNSMIGLGLLVVAIFIIVNSNQ